ncbi:TPP-dependent trihydroxycyclohexane-1,2-dione (THcHDO) dehydratase [Bradyrhizobium japonicum]|nr:TPP-dependent trihydroxycyclohexane-1,2-dione (THcHDO) dehydratase [Bradyrhizobium elkanii]MCS3567813.1 TPP-dependent trihydroxycyclohexane-1,2-dione (THcHDO) dehydratase [Bradyrhizobium elkanii]MCS3590704.1 TPP-dependent trihydroxycyclohexane-1,2-dione (THcHDO) dehydratase [Bradyrhizobium elkanii]MCS3620147.1 TPP-dependent trihydroxycyclohexane-1,2-dione (THcHDO) dehydratase [Bradyrhizobium elkanii]GEC56826.1 hypothetical protein BEL01nite_58690 [Bradyrhizobium elkanii]
MRVYYYNHAPLGWVIVCARGSAPGRLSPIWAQTSASVWHVPGTVDFDEVEADDA